MAKVPTPMHNKVIVRIDDTYSLKMRKSGILAANAAHEEAEADSEGYELSEFIIRHGVVEKLPRVIFPEYDWQANENEINVGDKVFWPIINFFQSPIIHTFNGDVFIVVNYYDIHLKIVDSEPVPVNGYYLFEKCKKKESALDYSVEKDSGWYSIKAIGKDVVYDNDNFNYPPIWETGDRCLLNVPPFQLEAKSSEELPGEYYLAQKRHILISDGNIL